MRPSPCSSLHEVHHLVARSPSRAHRSARRPTPPGAGPATARAMVTRCCSPPDSSFGRCSMRSPSPTRSSVSVARRRASRRVHAGEQQRDLDVLDRAEDGDEVELLEHEPHRRGAVAGARRVAHLVQRLTVEDHPTAVDVVETGEAVEERRLPRARRAHHRDELAVGDVQVHVTQCRHLAGAGAIDLADVLRAQQRTSLLGHHGLRASRERGRPSRRVSRSLSSAAPGRQRAGSPDRRRMRRGDEPCLACDARLACARAPSRSDPASSSRSRTVGVASSPLRESTPRVRRPRHPATSVPAPLPTRSAGGRSRSRPSRAGRSRSTCGTRRIRPRSSARRSRPTRSPGSRTRRRSRTTRRPCRTKGPFPLVVYSHGSGGQRYVSAFLTEALAARGFVVAAADHTGNTALDVFTKTQLPPREILRIRPRRHPGRDRRADRRVVGSREPVRRRGRREHGSVWSATPPAARAR